MLRIPFVICHALILVYAACCIGPSVEIEAGSDSYLLISYYTAGEGKGHQKVLVPPLQ